jgi:hypothetical protein
MNLTASSDVTFAIGQTSIHLMNLSTVDVKSAPHAKHIASRISWLHTRDPGARIGKRASQFSLKLTKDEKRLDKTYNLPGGARQFRIYGHEANPNDI